MKTRILIKDPKSEECAEAIADIARMQKSLSAIEVNLPERRVHLEYLVSEGQSRAVQEYLQPRGLSGSPVEPQPRPGTLPKSRESYRDELAASYDRGAARYRQDDEIEMRSENYARLGGNLRRVTMNMNDARVLEIGCGTGRYFQWLRNVKLLVGTDLSAEMIKHARNPVRSAEMDAREIQLLQGDIYAMSFSPGAFDFIYSLGVFGYGAEITPEFCRLLHTWLAPGGTLYFNAIEEPSETSLQRLKRAVRAPIYRRLPAQLRQYWDARQKGVPLVLHSREKIERAMLAGGFSNFHLAPAVCRSPLWSGVHLECMASKAPGSAHLAAGADPAKSLL